MLLEIQNKKGDLLKTEADIICHQVNCLGIMGGGIAKQIKDTYPNVFKQYYDLCKPYQEAPEKLLGEVQICDTVNYRIANIFSQCNVDSTVKQTDYEAIKQGMRNLFVYLYRNKGTKTDFKIAFPKNYGCGLGGGDWKEVEKIIVQEVAYYAYKCNLNVGLLFVDFKS
ncbi:MAG: macro domain-containing protein [Candidatus Gastranaerophilaceae bacterium]